MNLIPSESIVAFVTLKDAFVPKNPEAEASTIASLRAEVKRRVGGIAVPDEVILTAGLPKTRSGKIMRRLLRKLAQGNITDLGDTSTLADPNVLDVLLAKTKRFVKK